MSILNINTTKSNKGIFIQGKSEVFGEVYMYKIKQDEKNKFMFRGVTHTSKCEDGSEPAKRMINWDISKYDALTISMPGATQTQGKEIKKIATELSKCIINREARLETDFIKLLNECNNKSSQSLIVEEDEIQETNKGDEVSMIKTDAQNEVAITKVERPNINKQKVDVSDTVKAFMKEFGTTKLVETLELAVGKYNDALQDISLLEERTTNVKPRELTKEEVQDLVLENIPQEYVEALDKVNSEPEDPDDDPKGGQSIPAFNVAEFKEQLKAEIIAELKEELKASSVPIVEEKKTVGIKLPTPIEQPIVKKEEIKKEEQPKTKKASELTLEDLNKMSYEKLQNLGSKLKLGSDNVANKSELIVRIAKRLNIKIQSEAKAEVAAESLNINKTESIYNESRANNVDYEEEFEEIDEDLNTESDNQSSVDRIKGMVFEDPAKQKLANLILSRKK